VKIKDIMGSVISIINNKTKPLNITLAQLNPTLGYIDGNAAQIIKTWKENNASDLIVFPELFICGYPPEDLVLNPALLKSIERKIDAICAETVSFSAAALISTPWVIDGNLYNAALLIENGAIKHVFTKHLLPNYSVFDEKRVFTSGELPEAINFRGHKLGIMICEDLWDARVSKHLKNQGAELLIAINASPYNYDQYNNRINISRARIAETGLSLIYVNMIGGQDELVFDGRSFVMNASGKLIYDAPAFEEEISTIKLTNKAQIEILKGRALPVIKQNELDLIYEALKLGLKDYVHKNGFSDVIIGLSGGVDSALTAAIAVDALGKDHVRCVMLPFEFTSQTSLDDAKTCAKMLGVSYDIMPINEAVKAFENIIPDLSGIAHENTQSRIRGSILMALSNASGAMLITTGNKSEMAVGYCTLYGDMNGGFNALKDVYKTEVYALSSWRGLPKNIINKEPTAELRAGQTDQDSLPPYDLLDDILILLIEHSHIDWKTAPDDLLEIRERCLKHPKTVEKIACLLKNTEYKRFQAAPGTRISPYGFGRDRRYPMTNNFVNKVEKGA